MSRGELPERVLRAHRQAQERGEDGYLDPDTGLFVLTEAYLRSRGECCGTGCRHCPYSDLPPNRDAL